MVTSVPELPNRTRSIPNRRLISSAATAVSSEGKVKIVPRPTRSRTASTTSGWEWPAASTPKAMSKSMYSLPSASQIREPSDSRMNVGYGS